MHVHMGHVVLVGAGPTPSVVRGRTGPPGLTMATTVGFPTLHPNTLLTKLSVIYLGQGVTALSLLPQVDVDRLVATTQSTLLT